LERCAKLPEIHSRSEFWGWLPKGLEIAELGVFRGEHAALILGLAEPSALHLVDVFTGFASNFGETISGRQGLAETLDRFEGDRRVSVYATDSIAWLAARPARSLDVVYLDTDHSYSHVRREIAAALPVLRPGGWICGHDHDAGEFPGVVKAVAELREAYPGAEFGTSHEAAYPSWFLRLPADA
jgi:SAM-dependent methyltransferase